MEVAANLDAHKSAGRRPVDDPSVAPRKGRSRITNGKVLIAGVDQRSPWVRRAKDVIAAHIGDLGGVDNTSAAERSIIRRASTLTVELERMETTFAAAGEASPLISKSISAAPIHCADCSKRSVCRDARAT